MPAQDVLPPWTRAPLPGCLARMPARHAPRPVRRPAVQAFHRLTLVDTLTRTFARTGRWMEVPDLAAIVRRFVVARPPKDEGLALYGADLPGFLAEQPELASRPWLAELARLEWAVHRLRQAPEVPELSASRIAALPPRVLRVMVLRIRPSFLVFASRWPVVALFDGVPDEEERPIRPEPVQLLLRRDHERGLVRTMLAPARFLFLREIAAGSTLGLAAYTATAADPGFDLARTFGYLVGIGAFAVPDAAAGDGVA
jgi:hypothetical protein